MLNRVLFACSVYKPNVGGVETSIHELSRALSRQGIETKLITKRFPMELSENERIDTTDVFRFNRPQNDAEYLSVLKWLTSHSNQLKSDIIHVIGVRRPVPFIALLLAKLWKVPVLVTFAGGDLPDQNDPESQKIWYGGLSVVPQSLRQADAWSAFSKYTAKEAKRNVDGLGQISIIYGGVNRDAITLAKPAERKRPYFFAARRLEYAKGIDILLEAFASALKTLPTHELVIAGDGSQRNVLEEQARRLNILDKVTFLGSIDQSEVFSLMKGAVAHICPSRTESGGLVNWEAQAAGCISIASDAGGIPEYVTDNETGLLFKNDNFEDLARQLIFCANEKEKVKEIRTNALLYSTKRGWDEFGRKYKKLYDHTIADYSYKPMVTWSPLSEKMAK